MKRTFQRLEQTLERWQKTFPVSLKNNFTGVRTKVQYNTKKEDKYFTSLEGQDGDRDVDEGEEINSAIRIQ